MQNAGSKLIADAGSTTVDWALIRPGDSCVMQFKTTGLNALQASPEEIRGLFAEAARQLPGDAMLSEIYYYGAGCATPAVCSKIEAELLSAFGADSAMVTTDLLGACRAMLGDSRGIACILGTGSNSCLYDGKAITSNIPPLGFILGDEGSGAALGKRLISDMFKKALPESLTRQLLGTSGFALGDILDRVYRQPAPGRFLASLVPLIADNITDPDIRAMVRQEFTAFLERNVMRYPEANSLPLNFTGSVAWHFRDILTEAARALGLKISKITPSPMPGLIEYHR